MARIVILLLLSSSLAFSQMFTQNGTPTGVGMGSFLPSSFQGDNSLGSDPNGYPLTIDISNSPFYEEEFQNGITKIGEQLDFSAEMRYNAAIDVIEFINDENKTKQLLRRPYITAIFGGKKYKIIEYFDGETKRQGYFNPLNEGSVQLLYMPKKDLDLGKWKYDYTKNGYGLVQKGYYRDVSAFYLKIKEEPAVEVKLSKHNILKALGDKTVFLNGFIDKYGLNLKDENDVIRLLNYYDTLLVEPEKIEQKS